MKTELVNINYLHELYSMPSFRLTYKFFKFKTPKSYTIVQIILFKQKLLVSMFSKNKCQKLSPLTPIFFQENDTIESICVKYLKTLRYYRKTVKLVPFFQSIPNNQLTNLYIKLFGV